MEWPGLVALALDPFQDLPLGKANVRLNADVGNESTLYVSINRLDANLEELLQFLRGEHFSRLHGTCHKIA